MTKQGSSEVNLQLPPGLTCRQCILQVNFGRSVTLGSKNNNVFYDDLQWTYITGNHWGTCSNGTQRLGCGRQETFRACSDIGVFPAEGLVLASICSYPSLFIPYIAYLFLCFAGLFLFPMLLNQSLQQWLQCRWLQLWFRPRNHQPPTLCRNVLATFLLIVRKTCTGWQSGAIRTAGVATALQATACAFHKFTETYLSLPDIT